MERFLSYSFAAAVAALLLNPAQAATVRFHVNPGLWQVVVTTQMKGQLPVSDAEINQLPPAQRARIMAAMNKMIDGAHPHKFKECMTPERIAKGFDVDKPEAGCTRNIITNTASLMEVSETCTTGRDHRSGHYRFQVGGMGSVSGTLNMTVTRDGKTMNIDGKMNGHWLASNCGSVKDVEIEN